MLRDRTIPTQRFHIEDKDGTPVRVTVFATDRTEPLVALPGGEDAPTLDPDEVEFARLLPLTPF